MKIGVSACLLGHNCKYNGKNNRNDRVIALEKDHELIPVCPEMLGGMSCPRIPCEIRQDRVINANGQDQTIPFESGAQKALEILQKEGAELVILQPRSPSCGLSEIYDGSFKNRLIPGSGVFAQKLKEANIPAVEASSFTLYENQK